MIGFSTRTTPGADQAVCSASSRSAQERMLPVSITLVPRNLDAYPLRIEFGAADEAVLDSFLDRLGRSSRVHLDPIADGFDAAYRPMVFSANSR